MVNIHFLSILRLHITDSVTRSNTGESACRLSMADPTIFQQAFCKSKTTADHRQNKQFLFTQERCQCSKPDSEMHGVYA